MAEPIGAEPAAASDAAPTERSRSRSGQGRGPDNQAATGKRRNKIAEAWISYPLSMIESPAMRALSLSGGAYKRRIAGKGKGKRGGYRVITYYAAEDIPVFLLALVSKGQRADISQADRNALKAELATVAENYRTSVQEKVKRIKD